MSPERDPARENQPGRDRPLPVAVECYAGYRGEETPRRFRFRERWIVVAAVLDRWLAPDHRYFKVCNGAGDVFILRQDVPSLEWELVSFAATETSPGTRRHAP